METGSVFTTVNRRYYIPTPFSSMNSAAITSFIYPYCFTIGSLTVSHAIPLRSSFDCLFRRVFALVGRIIKVL